MLAVSVDWMNEHTIVYLLVDMWKPSGHRDLAPHTQKSENDLHLSGALPLTANCCPSATENTVALSRKHAATPARLLYQLSIWASCPWWSHICNFSHLLGDITCFYSEHFLCQRGNFKRWKKDYVSSTLTLLGRPCQIYHLNPLLWVKWLQLFFTELFQSWWAAY